MKTCKHCNNPITSKYAKIFCSKSCAQSFNNKGVRRHGKPPNDCLHCGKKTKDARSIFCSQKCQAIYRFQKYHTPEEKYEARRVQNVYGQAKYRKRAKKNTLKSIKKYGEISDYENNCMKFLYKICPKTHEVHHIIPVDKGGPNRIWNLTIISRTLNRQLLNNMPPRFIIKEVLNNARLVKRYNS